MTPQVELLYLGTVECLKASTIAIHVCDFPGDGGASMSTSLSAGKPDVCQPDDRRTRRGNCQRI